MGARSFTAGFCRRAGFWLALLVISSQSVAWAQAHAGEPPSNSPQVQAATSAQGSTGSPKSEAEKKPERIFGVVPAYSVTDAQNAPPLTSRQKFQLFVSGTLDPFPFVAYAIQAGVEQAGNAHSDYGQGAAGYAKRFGAALADGTSARFFGTYVFPSLLHQDPRYFRKGGGNSWSRVGYSMSRGFVTRADSGSTQPNWSNIVGKFTAAGLSNLYYPADDRGGSLTLSRVGISLSYQMLGNLAIEFWPDIHRKLLGGNKKQGSPSPK
jgi:hypothetical protein